MDMMREAQEQQALGPGRLAKQRADLESTQASTQSTLLGNKKLGMENEVMEHTLPQVKIQAAKDLILKGSEADRKMFEHKVYEMIQSNDPKQQAYGKPLYSTLKSTIDAETKESRERESKRLELAQQGRNSIATVKATGEEQRKLEDIKTNAKIRVAEINNITKKLKLEAAADPKKWQELAVKLAVALRNEKDPEARAALNDELQFAQTLAERLAPQPQPQVNPGAVPNNVLVPGRNPTIPSAPGVKPALPDPLGLR
jgi:hypothetical protein